MTSKNQIENTYHQLVMVKKKILKKISLLLRSNYSLIKFILKMT